MWVHGPICQFIEPSSTRPDLGNQQSARKMLVDQHMVDCVGNATQTGADLGGFAHTTRV